MNKLVPDKYIQDLRKGSYLAFNKIYDLCADSLYGFVLLHTKSPSVAEDIVQDTFLRIWKIRETLSEEGSFKSLLFTIANHLIIDAFRQQINKPAFEDYIRFAEDEGLTENTIEEQISYDDFIEKLAHAKQQLTKGQRTIFEMSKEEGLSIPEIAKILNISTQTVKNQLTLALKTLRTELIKYNFLFSLFL
jgi:RNA polymerase sigma-70 factor (ECF subfamily)